MPETTTPAWLSVGAGAYAITTERPSVRRVTIKKINKTTVVVSSLREGQEVTTTFKLDTLTQRGQGTWDQTIRLVPLDSELAAVTRRSALAIIAENKVDAAYTAWSRAHSAEAAAALIEAVTAATAAREAANADRT